MFDETASSDNSFFGDFINQGLSGLGLDNGATAAKTLGGLIRAGTQAPAPASQPAAPAPAHVMGIALPGDKQTFGTLVVLGIAAAAVVYLLVRK